MIIKFLNFLLDPQSNKDAVLGHIIKLSFLLLVGAAVLVTILHFA